MALISSRSFRRKPTEIGSSLPTTGIVAMPSRPTSSYALHLQKRVANHMSSRYSVAHADSSHGQAVWLLAALCVTATSFAQVSALITHSKDCTQNGMACRFWEPDGYNAVNKYPLVIYLHGAGQAGNDNQDPPGEVQHRSGTAVCYRLFDGWTRRLGHDLAQCLPVAHPQLAMDHRMPHPG